MRPSVTAVRTAHVCDSKKSVFKFNVSEWLLESMHKALGLILSTTKRKKEKEKLLEDLKSDVFFFFFFFFFVKMMFLSYKLTPFFLSLFLIGSSAFAQTDFRQ
jgi:hypothetical protein